MARRKGRILAFQALYSWDVGRIDQQSLLEFEWAEDSMLERMGEDGLTFARLLITGTIEHIVDIDGMIKKHLTNWDFDRLNKVDLAILRML